MSGLNKNAHRSRKVTTTRWTLVQGSYLCPPREDCEESPIRAVAGSVNSNIQVLATSWRQGRIVDFAIQLQYRLTSDGEWLNYRTIDCKHSNAHMHEHRNGERHGDPVSLKILNTPQDVQKALGLAIQRIWREKDRLERWLEHNGVEVE